MTANVRDRLEVRLNGMPDMDEIANGLHVTPRTLRRRVRDEGLTFLKLRDEVRVTRAEQFLAGARLSMEEIADRLGCADAGSFVNAFNAAAVQLLTAFDETIRFVVNNYPTGHRQCPQSQAFKSPRRRIAAPPTDGLRRGAIPAKQWRT